MSNSITARPARGLSAYQVAVGAGFSGTIADWLASLKGDKGDAGDGEGETPVVVENIPMRTARKILPLARNFPLVALAAPPTITVSAGSAASTIVAPLRSVLNADPVFRSGLVKSEVALRFISYNPFSQAEQNWIHAGAVDVGSERRGGTLGIVFGTDAPIIELWLSASLAAGSAYRIWINDRPVALAPSSLAGDSSLRRVKIDNGSTPIGKIMIEADKTVDFGGVTLGANYSVWAIGSDGPRIMIVGDSFADGTGADVFMTSYSRQLGERLGVVDTWVNGEGAIGWTRAGSLSTKTLLQKLATDVLAYKPDWVIIAVGMNDSALPAVGVGTDATAYLAALLEGLPNAGVTVIGPFRSPVSATSTAHFAAVKAAVEAHPAFGIRLAYVDTLAEVWQSGTGRVGATAGTGNSNIYIGADGVHPVQVGHDYLAQRSAAGVTKHLLAVANPVIAA